MLKVKCIKEVPGYFTEGVIYSETENNIGFFSVNDNGGTPHYLIDNANNVNWFNEHFIKYTEADNKNTIYHLEIDTVKDNYIFVGDDAQNVSNAINQVSAGAFLTNPVPLSDGTVRTFNTNFIVSVRYNHTGV